MNVKENVEKISSWDYVEIAGQRIQELIEESFTFENGCKRNWTEDDCDFYEEDVAWIFTQKGQRLYDSLLRRVNKIIEAKYPSELIENSLEDYTGVIYP